MRSNREVLSGFIVFEGPDGAGTTTQTDLLCRRLSSAGLPVQETSEPTGGPIGLIVREILGGRLPALPATVAYLFAADRNEHLNAPETGILAALSAGTTVISDRYLFSSLAYQTVDTDWDVVAMLNARFPMPELVIYLDLPVETALRRLESRIVREIYEHDEFQRKVHANYGRALELASAAGSSVLRVDGTKPQAEIHEEIWQRVRDSVNGRAGR